MSVSDTAPATGFGRRLLRRLGRPAGGAAVAWVPLAAVICGLFTGALASRAAWETSRPQPDRAEAAVILTDVFPGHDLGEIDTPPALFVVYGHALRLGTVRTLVFGDGGEYQESATGAGALGALTARRGDTILNASISSQTAVDASYLSVELHRAPPPLVVPAGVLGTVLGAVAGWLVFGWVTRRTEGRRSRGTVNGLIGVATVLWWLPVPLAAPQLLHHHLGEPHPAWHPYWEWLGQPAASLLFLVGAVCVLLALGVAAGTRRHTTPGATTD